MLGITMTTRFSETTDMAVLGLMPRPIGQPLHNILGQVYLYGITGVRAGREGNIGPALISLSRSMSEPDYRGIDLSDPTGEWIYLSPMSWKNDSTKAMWIERQRDGNGLRVQIVTLLEYQPEDPVQTVATPDAGTYTAAPAKNSDYDTTVMGADYSAANYTDGYACFGWQECADKPHEKNGDKVTLHYVRNRNILNKTELTRLQRQFEDCMEQIQSMQRRADSIPLAASLTAGVVGTVLVAGSVFAVTATPPLIWLTILLAIPGFLLCGAAYPICRREQRRVRNRLLPLIDQKYDEAAETARKAKKLL